MRIATLSLALMAASASPAVRADDTAAIDAAVEAVYAVISGEGEVVSDGVTAKLKPGMTAYLYTGAEVGIRQTGTAPLVLIISYPLEKVPQK